MNGYLNSLKFSLEEASAVNSMLHTKGWEILDKKMKYLLKNDIEKLKRESDYNKILRLQANIGAIERLYQQLDSVIQQGNQAEIDIQKY